MKPLERSPSSSRRGRRGIGPHLLIPAETMAVLVATSSPTRAAAPEVILDLTLPATAQLLAELGPHRGTHSMRDAPSATVPVALEDADADRGLKAVPEVGDGLGHVSLGKHCIRAGLD